MIRDLSSSGFGTSDIEKEEDADPRTGLVNLADVMLVFACGLMLALVAFWNLDVGALTELSNAGEVTEIQDVEEVKDGAIGAGGYVELGKVYQDPMTGKYYMLTEDIDAGSQDADSADPVGADQVDAN